MSLDKEVAAVAGCALLADDFAGEDFAELEVRDDVLVEVALSVVFKDCEASEFLAADRAHEEIRPRCGKGVRLSGRVRASVSASGRGGAVALGCKEASHESVEEVAVGLGAWHIGLGGGSEDAGVEHGLDHLAIEGAQALAEQHVDEVEELGGEGVHGFAQGVELLGVQHEQGRSGVGFGGEDARALVKPFNFA